MLMVPHAGELQSLTGAPRLTLMNKRVAELLHVDGVGKRTGTCFREEKSSQRLPAGFRTQLAA